MKPNKMTTVQLGNSVNRSRWRRGFLLIPLLLACFGLSPVAQAVLPAPDGGYPGSNTAEGEDALLSLTLGFSNTAIGYHALYSNTTGSFNTATGGSTLASNTTGGSNTANGANALINNTTGNSNTANGLYSLQNNTTGSNNIALGSFAGTNLTIGDNNIDVGNAGVSAEANTIRIGTAGTQTNAYMSGIYQTTVARGLAVVIDSTGHLGTKGSSERFNDAIKPMDEASEAIHALKPITFHH